jgi:hypothetical protein
MYLTCVSLHTTVATAGLSITQPDKIHLQETSDPNWGNALALLKGLREAFAAHESAFTKLLKQATSENKLSKVPSCAVHCCFLSAVYLSFLFSPQQALGYLQELTDCVSILAVRAKHVSYSACMVIIV